LSGSIVNKYSISFEINYRIKEKIISILFPLLIGAEGIGGGDYEK